MRPRMLQASCANLLDDALDAGCPVVPQVVGDTVSCRELHLLKLLESHALGGEGVEQAHLDHLRGKHSMSTAMRH